MSPESAADTAWKDANNAALKLLAEITNSKVDKNCFLGDDLPDDKSDLWVFIISGGPEQTQNYQCPVPACRFIADGFLFGRFLKMDDGFALEGKIRNQLPAYKQGPGSQITEGRGLPPNIRMFEMTLHPRLESRRIELSESRTIAVWELRMFFRIEYGNKKD